MRQQVIKKVLVFSTLFYSFLFADSLEDKYFKEFSAVGTKILDRYTPKFSTFKKVNNLLSETGAYKTLIIEVDSSKNMMYVKGKNDKGTKKLKTYKVSTAKKNIKKPLGVGQITSIALNPLWYPTADTIQSFKKEE